MVQFRHGGALFLECWRLLRWSMSWFLKSRGYFSQLFLHKKVGFKMMKCFWVPIWLCFLAGAGIPRRKSQKSCSGLAGEALQYTRKGLLCKSQLSVNFCRLSIFLPTWAAISKPTVVGKWRMLVKGRAMSTHFNLLWKNCRYDRIMSDLYHQWWSTSASL